MRHQALVSIIIPFYNTGQRLQQLVGHLLTDRYSALEIICIDDCSTNDSYKYMKSISDTRLKLLKNKINSGPAAARNLGLEKAHGEFVMFLDSDDMVDGRMITKMVTAMNHDVDLAVCGFLEKYLLTGHEVKKFCSPALPRRKNETLRNYTLRAMIYDGRLYSSVNKIYRRKIIEHANLRFDEKLRFAEDTKFVLDYLKSCDNTAQIATVLEPLYIYNYGTDTSTVAKSGLRWQNWQCSLKNIKSFIEKPTFKQTVLLKKLRLRFKISHALVVARSNLNWRKQREYVGFWRLLLAHLLLHYRN